MAVTDLTGTKWAAPADWSASAGYGMYSVTGTLTYTWPSGTVNNIKITGDYSDGHNLYIGYKFDGSGSFTPTADTLYVWEQRANGFSPYKPSNGGTFILEITGGADTTNETLIVWLEANATQVIETTPTTITYNGTELASLEVGQTATIPQGVKAKTNVSIAFGSKGSITYKGVTTAIEAGKTANLLCAGKKFATDVVVAVEKAEDTDPYGLIGEWIFNSTIKTFPAQYNFDFETATGTVYVGIKGVGNRFLQYVYADGSVDTVYDKDYKGFDVFGANRIFISGGVDITNETFATWLKANATKQ